MFDNYEPNSFDEIHNVFANIDEMDLETVEVDEIKSELRILDNYVIDALPINAGTYVYRGVKRITKPLNKSELTYPDPSRINNYQRANRPREPIFYCSSDIRVLFVELGLKPGDHVAISKWLVEEKIIVMTIGYIHEELEHTGSVRKAPNLLSKLDHSPNPEQSKLIYKYLSEVFSRVVEAGHEYEHKITVAIAELLVDGSMEFKNGTKAELAGIIYPTIAGDGYGENLAIKTAYVDTVFRLEEVRYIRVENHSAIFGHRHPTIDFANTFKNDGTIEWKGTSPD